MPYQKGVFGTRAAQEVSTAVGGLLGSAALAAINKQSERLGLGSTTRRETVQISYIDYFPLQPIAIKLPLILLFDSVIQF
jgi:hypothetical protein